jgi:hypothetical protein
VRHEFQNRIHLTLQDKFPTARNALRLRAQRKSASVDELVKFRLLLQATIVHCKNSADVGLA